jgi:NADH:ubiquinone oxidoreductase subunit 5 (subunit L)/multisubunit Na+/H+ antiporter MnhA subunit
VTPVYSGDVQQVHAVGFLWALPLLPAAGAAVLGLFGRGLQRRFGRPLVAGIAIAAVVAAAVVAVIAVVGVLLPLPAGERYLLDARWTLLGVGALKAGAALALDPLSGTLALVITIVGALIHVYSAAYMEGDGGYWRYFCYLNLFVAAMLVLVLADNFILMFIGWEGVGFCSWLLIGFWYDDAEKTTAANKAFILNRVGDAALLAGVALLFWGLGGTFDAGGAYRAQPARTVLADVQGGAGIDLRTKGDRPPEAAVRNVTVGSTLVFREIADQLALRDLYLRRPFAAELAAKTVAGVPLLFLVCLGLFLGAAGKSAQIPLQGWLPDAMAGPSPVSALIHAATMVTAGVYMIARLGFLFALSPGAMGVVAAVGAVTALGGAVCALAQYDIKRILAFSTVSQLGFMFLAVGVGAAGAGIFHLVTHACFKACLFLAAGSVIHGLDYMEHDAEAHVHAPRDARLTARRGDPQDVRNMGGLAALMPRTHGAYLVAALAIAGFPVAAGFYSKDAILWSAFRAPAAPLLPGLLWVIGFIAAGLTSFYMARSYYLVFRARPAPEAHVANVHESPRRMTVVMAVLAAASVLSGPLLGWPEAWGGRPSLPRFLDGGAAAPPAGSHALEWGLQLATVAVAVLGWLAARACFRDVTLTGSFLQRVRQRFDRPHWLAHRQFRADGVYYQLGVLPAHDFARAAAWIDRRLIDPVLDGGARALAAVARLGGRADDVVVDGAVDAVSRLVLAGGRRAVKLQTGRINNYVLGIVLGLVALVVLTFLLS